MNNLINYIGSFVSYRDIRTKHGLTNSVYKVEWYLSTAFGSQDQFFQIPSETSDTFYLSEYMIGHYLMVKVYRAIKYYENRSYVYSVSQKGPICPTTQLCHNILINSSRKSDFHDVLISTLDLDVLFAVVDKSSKFGEYKPFNNPNVVKNYPHFQRAVTFTEDNLLDNESGSEDNKQVAKVEKSLSAEVVTHENSVNNDKIVDKIDPTPVETVELVQSDTSNELEEENYLDNIADDLFEDENVQTKIPRGNYIKLKAPSKEVKIYDLAQDGDHVENSEEQEMTPEQIRSNKESLKFLYGISSSELDLINESTTVSDLSEDEKKTNNPNKYIEKGKKKRFSIFNLFKSNKRAENLRIPNDKPQKQMKRNQKTHPQQQNINKNPGKVKSDQKNVVDDKELVEKLDEQNHGLEQPDNQEPKPVKNQPDGNISDFEIESGDSKMYIKQYDDIQGSNDKIPMDSKLKGKWSLKLFNKGNAKAKIEGGGSNSSRSSKSTDSKPDKKNKKPKKVIYDRKREKQQRALRAKSEMNNSPTSNSEFTTTGSEDFDESVSSNDFDKKLRENPKSLTPQKPAKRKDKPAKSEKNKPLKGEKHVKGPKSPNNSRISGSRTPRAGKTPTNSPVSKPIKGKAKTGKNPPNKQNMKVHETKKGKGGIFSIFKKNKHEEAPPQDQIKPIDPREQEKISLEKYKRIVDTIKFVPVKLRICLNELIITFGLTSLSLRWNQITVEKADQLCFSQFPSIQQQLENKLTIVYNNGVPIKVRLRTQSSFQRNSIDRCDRELNTCFYDGIKRAYVRVCAAYYEASKRNEEKNQN
eukprot:XP_764103.1 hypothetical protein [Theileria parva strain Muguga]